MFLEAAWQVIDPGAAKLSDKHLQALEKLAFDWVIRKEAYFASTQREDIIAARDQVGVASWPLYCHFSQMYGRARICMLPPALELLVVYHFRAAAHCRSLLASCLCYCGQVVTLCAQLIGSLSEVNLKHVSTRFFTVSMQAIPDRYMPQLHISAPPACTAGLPCRSCSCMSEVI